MRDIVKLFEHQQEALELTKEFNKVAYYYDMGLGKTFIASEKAVELGTNILVVCQKSKIDDWYRHFSYHYHNYMVNDLTDNFVLEPYVELCNTSYGLNVGVINYDLIWRRPQLSNLTDFTLILDESSLIQNETTNRTKFILKQLHPTNVILLSGTPINGKYEQLWSQCHLLGWNISKELFYRQYIVYTRSEDGYPIISGYKNVERLKRKLRAYGALFKKKEEVIDLPSKNFVDIKVAETKEFKYFKKNHIVTVEDKELVGDLPLTDLLYQRMLCGLYNTNKLTAFQDLLDSTNDRLIVFYNFKEECSKLEQVLKDNNRPISYCNGSIKDFTNFRKCENGVMLAQYQSGAYAHNWQECNKIIYFSPPLSYEQFDQSNDRIHRIGQEQACFYYLLKSGIEYKIYETLAMRKDYTTELFKEERI